MENFYNNLFYASSKILKSIETTELDEKYVRN